VIKLILEYDGTGFSGWQIQPDKRTVQGELEIALSRLTGDRISTVAAGRTDAGVHALGQAVSFKTDSKHPDHVFCRALNSLLPRDVVVLAAEEAPEEFHARRSARGKCYRYLIRDRPARAALSRDRVWHLRRLLELAAVRKATTHLIGNHDFTSFRSASCEAKSPIREMRRIEVYRDGHGLMVIEMWASAFLKQMARAIVGTLTEVGTGKRRPEEIKTILEAKDRERAGVTAPPQGLYLVCVDYEEPLKENKG